MTLPVTHVATTDIQDMTNPGPERRMDLPGFDPEFVDFPHYIIRITERIWHDREVKLCLDYYGTDCAIHTLAGDISGAQTVVDNTYATLDAFPDRRLDGDNVIWSQDAPGTYYSSHLITSKMTNHGPSEFGPATGKKARVLTIADCLCRENRIVEEWLVRDNLGLVRQLGFDEDDVAKTQAASDIENGFSLLSLHEHNRRAIADTPFIAPDLQPENWTQAAQTAARALETIWHKKDWAALPEIYDFRVGAKYPGATDLYGHDEVAGFYQDRFTSLADCQLRLHHMADIPYLGEARDIAIRWSAKGTHLGDGRYGPASGAPVYILGVSHFRVMNGRIREEWTVWDDIAVRRQIATARLSA